MLKLATTDRAIPPCCRKQYLMTNLVERQNAAVEWLGTAILTGEARRSNKQVERHNRNQAVTLADLCIRNACKSPRSIRIRPSGAMSLPAER